MGKRSEVPTIEQPMRRSLMSLAFLRAQGFDVAHRFRVGDEVAVIGHMATMVVTECAFDAAHGLPVYTVEAAGAYGSEVREFIADEWRVQWWGDYVRRSSRGAK